MSRSQLYRPDNQACSRNEQPALFSPCLHRNATKRTTRSTRRKQQVARAWPWAALFCSRGYLWWLCFYSPGRVNSRCRSVGTQAMVECHVSGARCLGLTHLRVLLVLQCCGTELGRPSSGNRYRLHCPRCIIIASHQVFIGLSVEGFRRRLIVF